MERQKLAHEDQERRMSGMTAQRSFENLSCSPCGCDCQFNINSSSNMHLLLWRAKAKGGVRMESMSNIGRNGRRIQ